MRYSGPGAMAFLATASALVGSALIWVGVDRQSQPMNSLETEYVVVMPLLAAAVLLLVMAVKKLGNRPFLMLLWFSASAMAAHLVFDFVAVGIFYIPTVVLTVIAVLWVGQAGNKPPHPKI